MSLRLWSLFFLRLFSHCYSDLVISNVLSSSSLIFFLVFSILLMSLSPQFFGLVIVFFHSKVSVWYSIISVSLLRFSIFFICFQPICNCSLKHFFPNVGSFILILRSLKALCHLGVGICWLVLIHGEGLLFPGMMSEFPLHRRHFWILCYQTPDPT